MDTLVKVITPLISIGAGIVGSKIVDRAWVGFTGTQPPKRKDKEAQAAATFRQVLAFAVISAVVSAVIQTAADRGAQKAMARFTK